MRFAKGYFFFFSLVILLELGFHDVWAQTNTGSISGTVRDSTGAVVPDARVSVRNIATAAERTAQTDKTGGYAIPGLAPGEYDVTISKSGFADYKVQAQVSVGSFVTVSAQLSLTKVTSLVEVVVTSGTEVNTQSQEVSQLITPQQIQNLPSLRRDPYDLVALAGNVSSGDRGVSLIGNPQITGGGQNGTDRGVGFSINGQRASGTEVLLDGVENSNIFDTTVALYISQDATQEFRIITNNFDAQYGRASGGIVSVVTKSGTNNFHGDAWEFNRLSAYTANTFDNNAAGVPKGHYTRNQFGFDVGGPVAKNKLFFYENTEWLRVRSAASLLAYVPTPELLGLTASNVQNFFSTEGNKTFNFLSTVPKTTQMVSLCTDFTAPGSAGCDDGSTPSSQPVPFVGASAGTPANKCIAATGSPCPFSTVPDGTPAFGQVNYIAPVDAGGDDPQNGYDLVARVDYNLNSNTQMFFRFGREALVALPGSISATPYPQYNVGQTIYDNNYLFSLNRTFSSNLVSYTKLNFFRDSVAQQYDTSLQNVPTIFLYNNATVNGQPLLLPGFFDANTGTGGLPFGGPQNNVQITEDVAWTKGSHTMKFGGQMNYIQMNKGYGAYAQAIEQLGKNRAAGLDNLITGDTTDYHVAIYPQGKLPCLDSAFSGTHAVVIQTPDCTLTPPLTPPDFTRSYRYNDWALYAEDSWRVKPKFTFNFGVRYEHYGVQHNSNQKLDSNLYYGSGASIFEQIHNATMELAQNSSIGQLWAPRWGTVAPRVGFAYDVFGNGKTALRGGYGISYERNFGNVTFNMIQNPPNYASLDITCGLSCGAGVNTNGLGPLATSGGAPPALPPSSPRNVAQDIQVAQTQFWGLTLERQLGGKKALIALEYNGAHGVHLYDLTNVNEIGGGQVYLGEPLVTSDPNNPACTVTDPCLTRPNQQFTSINNRGARAFSHYNALNVRFQTQELAGTGLSFMGNYTWAHAMDNLSSTFSETSSSSNGDGNLGYLDPRNPRLDYGNADFDIRHRVTISPIWTEPFLKGSRGVLGQVAGGWSVSGIFIARTGTPFTISDSSSCLNCLTGPYGTPRYVPSSPVSSFHTGAGADAGGGATNLFNLLTLPVANSFCAPILVTGPCISDFGPYPSNMTTKDQFYGPGAWNLDLSVSKNFLITERIKLEFRAEGFDIFNHTNMYYNGFGADAGLFSAGAPIVIQGKRGGLGVLANNGQHDERRFGQFALRLHF